MEFIGILGIILGVLAIIYFIIKGLNLLIAAPLATLIVLIFNQQPVLEMLFGAEYSYMTELAAFVSQNFAIFMIGSVFAKYMDKSGATISIAEKVLSIVGTEKPYPALVALYAISSLLTLGGINVFVIVFALIPFARSLFERLNISWKLVPIAVLGGTSTFTMTMFPGSPSLQNIVPSTSLGTPLTAAPVISLVASITAIIFVLVYLKISLNKTLKNNESFDPKYSKNSDKSEEITFEDYPSFGISLVPIIVLLGTILLFSSINHIIIVALTVATLTAAILFRKQIPLQRDVINQGAYESLNSTLTTASTIAFGSVAAGVPAFSGITSALSAIPGSPLISLSLLTMIVGAITGSAVGAAGIAVESFAPVYLEMGINPEVIHRIITISSGAFGVMPQTGMAIIFNQLTGMTMKDTFKHQFITINVTHWIVLVVIFGILIFI